MLLRTIFDERLAAYTYLLGCQRTGEALLIDPQRDVDRYFALAAKEGLRLTAATETHIHADFHSGLRELAERGVKIFVSDEGDENWKYQWLNLRSGGGAYDHQLLKHGDIFRVGGIELQALHTPGHTPEHLSFLVTDRGGGATGPLGIATGDFVFVGDLGRPDLLETAAGQGGAAAPSARRLYHSARNFLTLPEYLQVWPAHGAGSACGKALGAVPSTTVGYETRFSPALRLTDEGEFVEFILSGQPEPPLYFARMKRDNKLGPKLLGALPQPRELPAETLAALAARGVAVVDTRDWAEFRRGHLPGALHLPLTNSFTTDAGSLLSESDELCLICPAERVEEAVRELVRVGLDRISGWARPEALAELARSGAVLKTAPEQSPAEADASRRAGAFVLDVRRQTEFVTGHIPGARNIAHTRLAERLAELPRDRPILVNCQSGARSARATALLRRQGFEAVNLAGGIVAWEQAGNAVER